MFQRTFSTRISLAVAALSAVALTLPAQAGLLGGAGLGSSAGGMGGFGPRSLDVAGMAGGRADADAARGNNGGTLREALARNKAAAGDGATQGLATTQGAAQGDRLGQAAARADGATALAGDRAGRAAAQAEGSGDAQAASTAMPTAPTARESRPVANGNSPGAAPRAAQGSGQDSRGASNAGRAEGQASGGAQAPTTRYPGRVEAQGSASAQASVQR